MNHSRAFVIGCAIFDPCDPVSQYRWQWTPSDQSPRALVTRNALTAPLNLALSMPHRPLTKTTASLLLFSFFHVLTLRVPPPPRRRLRAGSAPAQKASGPAGSPGTPRQRLGSGWAQQLVCGGRADRRATRPGRRRLEPRRTPSARLAAGPFPRAQQGMAGHAMVRQQPHTHPAAPGERGTLCLCLCLCLCLSVCQVCVL